MQIVLVKYCFLSRIIGPRLGMSDFSLCNLKVSRLTNPAYTISFFPAFQSQILSHKSIAYFDMFCICNTGLYSTRLREPLHSSFHKYRTSIEYDLCFIKTGQNFEFTIRATANESFKRYCVLIQRRMFWCNQKWASKIELNLTAAWAKLFELVWNNTSRRSKYFVENIIFVLANDSQLFQLCDSTARILNFNLVL